MRRDLVRKIEFALQHHGGEATSSQIYAYVEKSLYQLELKNHKDWRGVVRRHLHYHTSDSKDYRGERDLFVSVSGTNKTRWRLRGANILK